MIRSVCILGLGNTGLSCLRYLTKLGVEVCVMDSRDHPPHLDVLARDFPDIPLHLGAWQLSWLHKADCVVISPGLSLQDPLLRKARSDGVKFWSDIELFAHYVKVPVFGVTGTNGKTTVTSLAGALLKDSGFKVALGGNLGPPACDLLMHSSLDCIVLELSSFQLEQTYSLVLESAVVLNCTKDHLDRYDSFADYAQVKRRIFEHAKHKVYHLDDALTHPDHCDAEEHCCHFSSKQAADFSCDAVGLSHQDQRIITHEDLGLSGACAVDNALAACALVSPWVSDARQWRQTLQRFQGLPHRCEPVFTSLPCTWYNDSKGTNLGAMVSALDFVASRHQTVVLLLGGVNKGANFSTIAAKLASQVKKVITFGRDGEFIAKCIAGHVDVDYYSSLEEATLAAHHVVMVEEVDAVLFSPACASFDAFSGYQQRGDVFRALVSELAHE